MDADTQRLVERAGLRFENDGLPRTAGRILALLLLSPEARSLDEIAAELQVSKAGVSTNTRLLERSGGIVRETRPGDRRDYLRIAEDLQLRILDHWMEGAREMTRLLRAALQERLPGGAVVRERMETLSVFFDHMLEEIGGASERWMRDHERERALAGSLTSES
jgi:DNA-binding MarR family transcriptional regulator